MSLPIEEEIEISNDKKGFSILKSEFELALKEIRNKKAAGIDEIPIELVKNMGEHNNTQLYHLCNDIYDSGQWPQNFLHSIVVPIEKKKNAQKCEEYRTISLIFQAAKILLRILNRRLYAKVDPQLGEEQEMRSAFLEL